MVWIFMIGRVNTLSELDRDEYTIRVSRNIPNGASAGSGLYVRQLYRLRVYDDLEALWLDRASGGIGFQVLSSRNASYL